MHYNPLFCRRYVATALEPPRLHKLGRPPSRKQAPTPLQSRSWSAEIRILFSEVIIQELRHLREILLGLWCRGVSLVLRMRLAFENL
jgi:hypothetical protein